jgi:DNA-binding NarL/FixJ family response regulator
MAESIRILLVDDHAVVRSGLRRVLDAERDLEVVAEAGDAQHAIFESRAHKPDIVLLDVTMPGRSGVDVIRDLLKDAPHAKVVLLSMEHESRYVRRAFDSGAAGYVLKDAADAELVAAVREVSACRSSGCRRAPSLSSTRSSTVCSKARTTPESTIADRGTSVPWRAFHTSRTTMASSRSVVVVTRRGRAVASRLCRRAR